MIDDWKAQNIDTDEVERLVSEYLYRSSDNYSISNLSIPEIEGNSDRRVTKYYVGESHFRYIIHLEKIVAVKIIRINLSYDSPW